MRAPKLVVVAGLTAVVVALAAADGGARAAATPAYLNTHLPFAERAADLVSRMTLQEKAAQLSTTNAPAIPRLGVQEYAYWSEALHGVNAFWGGDYHAPAEANLSVHATSFPSPLAASLTWDPALMRRESTAISDEARGFLDKSLFGNSDNDLGPSASDYGSLFYFAPTVNMDRDPRWGRADETYGEDPFLTAAMASAYVEGMQGEDAHGRLRGHYLKAVTTLKHYALNNVEDNRMGISSDTSEGTIRDYYTRQFRDIIRTAHAAGAMSSYNAINGTPAVADNLTLNLLLRRTFGFRGYVTSDCGAVGTTYRRPDGPGTKLGNDPATASLATSGHDWAPPGWTTDHGDQSAQWTKTSVPPATVRAHAGGEAWALRAGTGLNCVGFNGEAGHPAFWDPLRPTFSDENRLDYIQEAITAHVLSEGVIDRALVPVFTQRMRTGEFDPRGRQPYTRITKHAINARWHRTLTQTVGDEALTLLQNRRAGRAHRPLLPVDPARVKTAVVVGDQADNLFLGDYSGTPLDQMSVRDGIKRALPHAHVVYDDGGSSTTATKPASLQDSTRDAIKKADIVVVMVGTDAKVNTEGYDRKTLALPGNYASLVKQVAAVGNPRVALLVQSAGPVDLRPARSRVASILFSAANGQRQGSAAADVLFGRVDPSGHLSFTWYAGDDQLPPKNDYDLTPARTRGLGRTYMFVKPRPTFPFGFGMSYTRFHYSRAHVNRSRVPVTGSLRVSLTVTNTGARAGATLTQLYATPPHTLRAVLPRRRLVGFARTRVLPPGASQRISIGVRPARAFRFWAPRLGREVVHRGTWELRIGRSSHRIVQSLPVHVTGSIPRSVATVAIAPPQLTLSPGQTLDLRGRNPWLEGLAPTRYQRPGDTIVSAVRADDSFVSLAGKTIHFTTDRPSVLRVGSDGVARAVAPGVATVTVRVGGASASTPFVVK